MLLTKNNAALRLLFDCELLKYNRTEVIFGSDFPNDKSDLQIWFVIPSVFPVSCKETNFYDSLNCLSLFPIDYVILVSIFSESNSACRKDGMLFLFTYVMSWLSSFLVHSLTFPFFCSFFIPSSEIFFFIFWFRFLSTVRCHQN